MAEKRRTVWEQLQIEADRFLNEHFPGPDFSERLPKMRPGNMLIDPKMEFNADGLSDDVREYEYKDNRLVPVEKKPSSPRVPGTLDYNEVPMDNRPFNPDAKAEEIHMADADLATFFQVLSKVLMPEAAAAEINKGGKPTTPQEDLSGAVDTIQKTVTTPDSQLGIGDYFVKGMEMLAEQFPDAFSQKDPKDTDEEMDEKKETEKAAEQKGEEKEDQDSVFKKFIEMFSVGDISMDFNSSSTKSSGTSTAKKDARAAEDSAFKLNLN